MTESYLHISPSIARRLRLIMTDVDGTLTSDGTTFAPSVAACVKQIQSMGVPVGLVSGRDLPRLLSITGLLGTNGPLIAENGGVARLLPDLSNLDLGYSRGPALDAVRILKESLPGRIVELDDNRNRLVDVTISADGVPLSELKQLLPGMQVMDSGYMIHLMAAGINKGDTLGKLLPRLGISPDDVMVFGDSTTDVPLFERFASSVLVHNPLLSAEQQRAVLNCSAYESDLGVEKGFCQVLSYIAELRKQAG